MSHILLDQIDSVQSSCVTVGFFDGFHLGHRSIVNRLVGLSREAGLSATAVTFWPHPRSVLTGDQPRLLTSLDEKAELIRRAGVDRVVVVPFTTALSKLGHVDFLTEILIDRLGLEFFVAGHDHAFGRDAQGDTSALSALGSEMGFGVEVLPPLLVNGAIVSSSEIRRRLSEEGDAVTASRMLGRRYAVTGTVVEGDRRGRTVGFPTANLEPIEPLRLTPANGVYAVRVSGRGLEGVRNGIMNIGVRPTLTAGERRVAEIHVLDFSGDLYGARLNAELVERIRPERKFDGVAALQEQIALDIRRCIAILSDLS